MIEKCLFPVAGFGTRFLPVTKSIAKEMLPICSKPIIHYSFDESFQAGIKDLFFIINDQKKSIKDYFSLDTPMDEFLSKANKDLPLKSFREKLKDCNVSFINQDKMMGLGHAVLQGKDQIKNNPFAVILPDDVCYSEDKSVLQQMIDVYDIYPGHCVIGIEEIDRSKVDRYGIVDGQLLNSNSNIFKVKSLTEKPNPLSAPSNLAVIGRYILTSEIFNILEKTSIDGGGEIQLTNALNILAQRGLVIGLKFKGRRIDCGNPTGLIEANNFFLKINQCKNY